ncbi:cysteine desulfurase family protein [Calditerrivibrio nitroreducens]|uniref:cysteine desulfurase n=1 Tax=Calditerrivibrio nitroreducens (strain DSM 19672 / NBRC 101217 / Yu37-1) TaxID=768670 RepID=E4TFS9_CALNY|nr:cysteine desulfurase family protein [Calditerrivibrio nitroreducens]ADR19585.1 aminotransferase class V [Calditerrivibrio nitroreducens DSM 19672]
MIYLDNVAGTKPDPRVVEKMLPFLTDKYGNPSAHFYPLGRESFQAINEARENVANLINAESDEIIFTSCGTESNNLAIKGVANSFKYEGKKHIVISEIEHFSIQNSTAKLSNQGYKTTKLKVDNNGKINLEDLKKAITGDTLIVSIMHANPEIGVIQNIQEIGEICKEKGVLFHVDAIASTGHIDVDVKKFNCDLLSLSAQNFYGPRGVAALYIKKGVHISPLFDGGFQENGFRSGSENVPGIVGLGEAARIAKLEMDKYSNNMKYLRDKLINALKGMFSFLHITGDEKDRLPGHVSFWIEYIEGESLLLWYALKGICAASGSACSSNILAEDEDDLAASHVLTAIGVPNDICAGSITFSMSKYTTESEIDEVIKVTPEIVNRLCEMSPYYKK